MENFDEYSVIGKGGLIRAVAIPHFLSAQLKNLRLKKPRLVTDREIKYLQLYDISFGQKWSQSFTSASQSRMGFSHGAHGLRHTYTQERIRLLLRLGQSNQEARSIVSSELGHFRADIIEFYLR